MNRILYGRLVYNTLFFSFISTLIICYHLNCQICCQITWNINRKRCRSISMLPLWLVTLHVLVGGYQRFGEIYWLHLEGWNLFLWNTLSQNFVTTEKTKIDILTAVRTSNFIQLFVYLKEYATFLKNSRRFLSEK